MSYENPEPTVTVMTKDFIRDEIATIPSATPYQRHIDEEYWKKNGEKTEKMENPDAHLVTHHSFIINLLKCRVVCYKINLTQNYI